MPRGLNGMNTIPGVRSQYTKGVGITYFSSKWLTKNPPLDQNWWKFRHRYFLIKILVIVTSIWKLGLSVTTFSSGTMCAFLIRIMQILNVIHVFLENKPIKLAITTQPTCHHYNYSIHESFNILVTLYLKDLFVHCFLW